MKNKTLGLLLMGAIMTGAGMLNAQDADPFAAGKPKGEKEKKVAVEPLTIRAVYEVFSLPMKDAAAIQRSKISDEEFYEKMLTGLKEMSVKQETFTVVRTLPGSNVDVFEGHEYLYNTEAEGPKLPNLVALTESVDLDENDEKAVRVFPVIPVTPVAFSCKNIGKTFEIEPMMKARRKVIELSIAAEEVSFIGRDAFGQGVSKIEMPRFAVQALKTGVTVISGKPSYIGTVSPSFVLQAEDVKARVWFAFVTASAVKL